MSLENDFPADLKPIEAALAGLMPAAARVDRDRLMYLAGAAAATAATQTAGPSDRSSVRIRSLRKMIWPLSTAALLIVSIGFGSMVAFREPAERLVYVERPTERTNSSDVAIAPRTAINSTPAVRQNDSTSADYLVLRDQVLRLGVGALDRAGTGGNGSQ